MPNVDNMLKFASENGAYMFALVQLQITDILIAYMCFRHIDRMSEAFQNQLKMLTQFIKEMECSIRRLDDATESLKRLTRSGANVDDTSNPGRDSRTNDSVGSKVQKGSKTSRRGKT